MLTSLPTENEITVLAAAFFSCRGTCVYAKFQPLCNLHKIDVQIIFCLPVG